MSDKLRITKNDIGKKIYKIELSEYMKEYFTVLASSEDEATEKMWDIKSGWTKDSQVFSEDDVVHEGWKDNLDDLKVFEMDTVTEEDFDKDMPDDWIYAGLFSCHQETNTKLLTKRKEY